MKDELVTSAEAAHLLRVGPRRFQQLVQRGIIRPDPSSPSTIKQRRFRMRDVAALQQARENNNPEAAFVLAQESALETKALRREVSRIRFVLGVDIPTIPLTREAMVSTLLRAEDALREPPTMDHEFLLTWARIFNALSEDHFEAIASYTGQKEPWRAFLALARKLCLEENFAVTRTDAELASIYRVLNATLRRLRQTAYFYIKNEYGKVYAARLLPEVKGCPHEDVIALAFNNLNWEAPQLPKNPDNVSPGRYRQST